MGCGGNRFDCGRLGTSCPRIAGAPPFGPARGISADAGVDHLMGNFEVACVLQTSSYPVRLEESRRIEPCTESICLRNEILTGSLGANVRRVHLTGWQL